jgi:hypothetical protein
VSRLASLRVQRGVAAAIAPLAALLLVANGIHSARATVPSWPASSTLLIGEVVTGGTTASDEFVEIYNASTSAVSLANLELVYVTSTGGTMTRKAAWADGEVLGARRHLLVANASGAFGTLGDVTYSGGFAATGGALVLREIGGAVLDALAWGDATNPFVEGTPGIAPDAGWSLERLPGGGDGNAVDSNDNGADTRHEPAPVAQGAVAPPTPQDPVPSATATSTAPAPPTPPGSPTPIATATPDPTPWATPLGTPPPSTTATVSPADSPSPTPVPTTTTIPVSVARGLPLGAAVVVTGTVTAEAGTLVDPRTIAIQDESGGIAVRLLAGSERAAARGDRVALRGTITDPYGNLTIKMTRATDLTVLGRGGLPAPIGVASVSEAAEGRLIRMEGVVGDVDRTAASTVSVLLESGTRATAFRSRHVPLDSLQRGHRVRVTGIAVQRRTSTAEGYRVWLREARDLTTLSAPPPGATPKPPTSPGRSSPPPAPARSIAQARSRTGAVLSVTGVVTTRAGLLDTEGRRVVLQDASGAILVRLPKDGPKPGPGDRIETVGKIGTYYGARQLAATAVTRRGRGTMPLPLTIGGAPIAERLEWQLVRATGTVTSLARSGRSWRLDLRVPGGAIPVVGEERAAISSDRLANGATLTVIGLARRPRSTASDRRFAIAPRSPGDLAITDGAGADPASSSTRTSPSSAGDSRQRTGAPGRSGGAAGSVVVDVDLGAISSYPGRTVRVGGEFLGRHGPLLTLRDATGTGLARLPTSAARLLEDIERGEALNVTGVVRRAAGRWQVVARTPADVDRIAVLEDASTPAPTGEAAPSAGAPARPPASAQPILSLAGAVPPTLVLVLAVSIVLTACGLHIRRRDPREGARETEDIP